MKTAEPIFEPFPELLARLEAKAKDYAAGDSGRYYAHLCGQLEVALREACKDRDRLFRMIEDVTRNG